MFFLPSSLLWLACLLKSFPLRWKLSEKCAHEILKISLIRSEIGNRYFCFTFCLNLEEEKKHTEDEERKGKSVTIAKKEV